VLVEYDPADVDSFIAVADSVEARQLVSGATSFPRGERTHAAPPARVTGGVRWRAGGGKRGGSDPSVRWASSSSHRRSKGLYAFSLTCWCLTRRGRRRGAFEVTVEGGAVLFSKLKAGGP